MKMNKISYEYLHIKIIAWIIIPLILIALWLLSVLFFNPSGSFSTLVYPHSSNSFLSIPRQNTFLKEEEIVGNFKGDEDNLGIIAIRMSKNLSGQVDAHHKLLFKIREINSKSWVFQKVYFIDSIRENEYLFFGFPRLSDSKGKQYLFKIISLNGDTTNATKLILSNDSVVTKYVYKKNELIINKKLLLYVFYKKIISTLLYPQAFFSTVILLLPLLYYALFLFLFDSILAKTLFIYKKISFFSLNFIANSNVARFLNKQISKTLLGGLTITLIIADIFLLQDIYFGVAVGLYGFWIIAVIKDKLSYKTSLLWSFIFLLLSVFFISLDFTAMENNSSMWGYLFFLTTVVQSIFSESKKLRKL